MIRIMLLTFVVLGWAWFELSGGSDFVPGQHGVTVMADVKPVAARPETVRPTFQQRELTPVPTPDPAPVVTSLTQRDPSTAKTVRVPDRVDPLVETTLLAPVSSERAAAPAPVDAADASGPEPVVAASSDDFAALLTETIRNSAPPPPPSQDEAAPLDDFDPTEPIQRIAGLGTSLPLGTAMGASTAPEFVVVDTDLRIVTGTRVNVRGGPATSYTVVTQLFQGDEVEVLDDTGDGWVKLRSMSGDVEGWMSDDFLQATN